MTQDFRPEDLATLERALVTVDAALLLVASTLSLLTIRPLAKARDALSARIPQRFRNGVLRALLALFALGCGFFVYRTLDADHWPQAFPETLAHGFEQTLLLQVCTVMLALALGLKLLRWRVTVWMRLLAEALLVPCAYLLGLAIIYLSLSLVDLEIWNGFKRGAFFSAAVFALPVALIPGLYRPRGFGVVLALFLLIVFGDLIYLRYFGNIMPVLAISSGGQIWDVRDIIFKYTQRRDAWLLPGLAAGVALPFLWPKTPKADAPVVARGALDFLLIATSLVFILPIPGIVQGWMDSDRSWKVLNGTDAVQDSGIVVAHIKEVARSIRDARQHGSITPTEMAKVVRYHQERAEEVKNDADFGIARGTNLLILQVEAMQNQEIRAARDAVIRVVG